MIEISSRSWHLRLVRLLHEDYEPKGLCSYFWNVACAALELLILGAFTVATFPIWGPAYAIEWLWQKRPRRSRSQPTKPNLFIEWVKVKKRHICPLITVKEERWKSA